MKTFALWVFVFALMMTIAVLAYSHAGSRAVEIQPAEKQSPSPHMNTGELGRITYRSSEYSRVDVIETRGACIYVAVSPNYGVAITALPQSQTGGTCR